MSQIPPQWPGLSEDPESDDLTRLAATLASLDGSADESGEWPEDLWATLRQANGTRWALPEGMGGGVDRRSLMRRYAIVAEGSLTAAFLLSQHDAAVRRLVN